MPGAGFWTSKPPAGTPLDRGYPGVRDLVLDWVLSEGAGARASTPVNESNAGTLAVATWASGDRGPAVAFAGGANEWIKQTTGRGLPIVSIDPWSIECRVAITGTVSLASVFGFGSEPQTAVSGTKRAFLMFGGSAPNNNVYFWGDVIDWDSGIPWITDGRFHTYLFTYDGGSALTLYLDGVPRASTSLSFSNNADIVIWAGDRHSAAAGTFLGRFDRGRIFARCLTPTEAMQSAADPYQMFAPPVWRRYFVPAGGAGATVTPSQLTATLTLQAPTVSAQRFVTVTPAQQTATLTLQTPTVSAAQNPTITPAQLTLTSTLQVPTVSAVRNPTVTPAQQTATLTLQTPTVSAERFVTVTPSLLTATLSLQPPTISAVQNVTVSPSQQAATLTLQVPTVSPTRNVTVAPSQQTATLTLFAPSVSAGGAVTVTPAQLTLTSTLQAPTVSAVRNVTVAPSQQVATLSLQTPAVSTTWNVTVSPAQQVATLTLQAPTVSAGGAVTVTPSQLTLTASLSAPAISTVRHVTVTPTQLTTTLTLQTPTVLTVVPPPPNVAGRVTAGSVVVGGVAAGEVVVGGVTAGMVVVGGVVAGSA